MTFTTKVMEYSEPLKVWAFALEYIRAAVMNRVIFSPLQAEILKRLRSYLGNGAEKQ